MLRLFKTPRFWLSVVLGSAWLATTVNAEKPNFVLILADDLGYGDIGCYGSTLNRTPHLDRLASEGMRFTDFHSNGPMCTPTRVALLTGRYQQRFGPKFDGPLSGKTQYDDGLPLEAETLAEALKLAGYATGMFGKWHLGYHPPFMPTRQGFDEFRGLTSGDGDHHSQIDRSGRQDWWHNEAIEMERGYTADLLTKHSVRFIERNRNNPFFLYVPHLAIHFPWQGPNDPPHRVHGKDYWNDKWGFIPDPNNVAPHVKAMIESLDQSVGQIIAALKRLELEKNTFVFFASDNGGYLNYGSTHRNISSNGPLHGEKTDMFEGGHRVPAIAWWPGRIKPGVNHDTVMTFDLFPTMIGLIGNEMPKRYRNLDGIDIAPALFNNQPIEARTLFWRMGDERAVRQGAWKWIQLGQQAPMLFDLSADLSEKDDLSGANPDIMQKLAAAFDRWEQNANKPFSP